MKNIIRHYACVNESFLATPPDWLASLVCEQVFEAFPPRSLTRSLVEEMQAVFQPNEQNFSLDVCVFSFGSLNSKEVVFMAELKINFN